MSLLHVNYLWYCILCLCFKRAAEQKTIFMFLFTTKLILYKFQNFPCSIHGEIPKNPLSELCEKRKSYLSSWKRVSKKEEIFIGRTLKEIYLSGFFLGVICLYYFVNAYTCLGFCLSLKEICYYFSYLLLIGFQYCCFI